MRSVTIILFLVLLQSITSCNKNNEYNLPDGINQVTIEFPKMGISISLPDSCRIVIQTSNYTNITYKDINISILANKTGDLATNILQKSPAIIIPKFTTNESAKIKTQHNYIGTIQTTTDSSNRKITVCNISHEENQLNYIINATCDTTDYDFSIIKHAIYSINHKPIK